MDISNNFSIGNATNMQNSAKSATNDMSMDDFLKVLSASMRMPSMSGGEGGSDSSGTDYISQMVQFSTMEQLTDIAESLNTNTLIAQQQQALNLLGKEVTLAEDSSIVTGEVEKVKFSNGFATIQVNGKDYYMNSIQEVGEKA